MAVFPGRWSGCVAVVMVMMIVAVLVAGRCVCGDRGGGGERWLW